VVPIRSQKKVPEGNDVNSKIKRKIKGGGKKGCKKAEKQGDCA